MSKEQGRQRLDQSLRSSPLAKRDGVAELIRDQLSKSPFLEQHFEWKGSTERVVEKRTADVCTFLEALRSVSQENFHSSSDHDHRRSWKLKEETDCMRVMYREGSEGTPFHTYCVEGIVNGPMLNAVCVAWEAPSYYHWWPQFTVPPFKILKSRWVKRIRVGEDVSHIRVKVPWPLATREVLMTQFELEYLQDDIILVLLGTAQSDPDEFEEEINGFSVEDLPPATPNVVRMEVAGGFILQKITSEQSYFRTVVELDIKLEHVPPWVINFITRQLVGNGYKLYQKAVLSSGKAFQKVISSEPLYNRIRHTLQHSQVEDPLKLSDSLQVEKNTVKEEEVKDDDVAVDIAKAKDLLVRIDPEVEWALQVLDKMIAYADECKARSAAAGRDRVECRFDKIDTAVVISDRGDNVGSTSRSNSSNSSLKKKIKKKIDEMKEKEKEEEKEYSKMMTRMMCFGYSRRRSQQQWPKLRFVNAILYRLKISNRKSQVNGQPVRREEKEEEEEKLLEDSSNNI